MRKLQFTKQAEKSITKLIKHAPEIARMIAAQIEKLREEPIPRNSTKIVGYDCYRAHVGSYRIIYEFNDDNLLVTIVEKRDKVYQKFRKHYS
ncbi:MAG: type II toxin-antitoxin system RelE/ParE family toxin [Pseudomonadota bacterium]